MVSLGFGAQRKVADGASDFFLGVCRCSDFHFNAKALSRRDAKGFLGGTSDLFLRVVVSLGFGAQRKVSRSGFLSRGLSLQ